MIDPLSRTRRTLFVPATYLSLGGLGLLINPRLALKMSLSTGEYGEIFPRFAGVLTLGLAFLVVQIIRKQMTGLYLSLFWVRVFFCASYIGLFIPTRDPLFLGLLALVGTGAAITGVTYLRERGALAPSPA